MEYPEVDREKVRSFLRDLTELTKKHALVLKAGYEDIYIEPLHPKHLVDHVYTCGRDSLSMVEWSGPDRRRWGDERVHIMGE